MVIITVMFEEAKHRLSHGFIGAAPCDKVLGFTGGGTEMAKKGRN